MVAGTFAAPPGSDKRAKKGQTFDAMRFLGAVIFGLWFLAASAGAQPPAKLRVGIFDRAPFAMKDPDGHWTGLAVEVWEQAAAAAGLSFEYVETSEERIVRQVARGEVDLAVGEIGVSAERERLVDFAQPYLSCPIGAAILRRSQIPHWTDFFHDLASHDVLSILILLVVAMLLFAALLWLVERRVERSHFGGLPLHGFGSALWFAAVTMTTVGYGDKTPRSVTGRTVVLFWMFLGVVIVSVFTGTVASSITLARAEYSISRASDLVHFRNGVLNGSVAQNTLQGAGIPAQPLKSLDAGLGALEAGKITAFIGGEISLRYEVNQKFAGKMLVLPLATSHVSYAFAMRPGFPPNLRESLNEALIDQTENPHWESLIERWTGPPARP